MSGAESPNPTWPQQDRSAFHLRQLLKGFQAAPNISADSRPETSEGVLSATRILESTPTEHVFEEPSRAPIFQNDRPFQYFSGPPPLVVHGISERIWQPTDTEPGQHRIVITDLPENKTTMINADSFRDIEKLAAKGMRSILAAFGFKTYFILEEDRESHSEPLHRTTQALSFCSSGQLKRLSTAFAGQAQAGEKFTIELTHPEEFSALEQIKALSQGKILIAREDPDRAASRIYDYYRHDSRLHFPAWLGMPPTITTGIYEQANECMRRYTWAIASGSGSAVDIEMGRIRRMAELLDSALATSTLAKVAAGESTTFGTDITELMRWGNPDHYEALTREHMANPSEDAVLVCRWG